MTIRAQDLPVSVLLDIAQAVFDADKSGKLTSYFPDTANLAQSLTRLNSVIAEFDPVPLIDLLTPEYTCIGCQTGMDIDTGYCDKCQQERAGLDI